MITAVVVAVALANVVGKSEFFFIINIPGEFAFAITGWTGMP